MINYLKSIIVWPLIIDCNSPSYDHPSRGEFATTVQEEETILENSSINNNYIFPLSGIEYM